MKSNRFLTVLAVSASAALLAVSLSSCSKSASASAVSSASSQAGGVRRGNMENRIKSGLSELVSAGTITQAQADKIETALTQNMGERRQNASGSGNDKSGSHPQWNGSRPAGNGSGAAGGRESQLLSSLVSDGTITQAQADAVVQKLFSFGNRNASGNSSGSNQSTSS